jgi:DNA-binding XRE family transcriptional regulator
MNASLFGYIDAFMSENKSNCRGVVKLCRIGKAGLMRFSSQIRAARALLGWSQTMLARSAGIGLATLQRIEQSKGVVKANFETVLKIQKTLENAGIRFTEDETGEIGVRLVKKKR